MTYYTRSELDALDDSVADDDEADATGGHGHGHGHAGGSGGTGPPGRVTKPQSPTYSNYTDFAACVTADVHAQIIACQQAVNAGTWPGQGVPTDADGEAWVAASVNLAVAPYRPPNTPHRTPKQEYQNASVNVTAKSGASFEIRVTGTHGPTNRNLAVRLTVAF